MIDIHSHFLPGVDDGAKTLDEAVAMVRLAAADGTTHLVATPHCNARFAFSAERNRALLEQMRAHTPESLTLLTGCDFHLSYENVERLLEEKSRYTVNQGTYLLTEFAVYGIAPQTESVFHRLLLNDLVPVVTHPERNPLLARRGRKLLRRLVEMGCPVQLTAGSLLGRFGSQAQEAAEAMLAENLAHLVASDAHDTRNRPPLLSRSLAWVEEKYGQELARALFEENPRAILGSRPLPYFPEPAPLKRRRFWFF